LKIVWLLILVICTVARAADTPNPRLLDSDDDSLQTIALSPDGELLATGGGTWNGLINQQQSSLRLWSVRTGDRIRELSGSANAVQQIVFTPDGRTLVAGSEDGTLNAWDVPTGRLRHTLARAESEPQTRWYAAAASPDSTLFAAANVAGDERSGRIKLWNLNTGMPIDTALTRQQWTATISGLRFLPDGKTLALALYEWDEDKPTSGKVELRDLKSGALVHTIDGGAMSMPRALSPDGTFVATMSGGPPDRMLGDTLEPARPRTIKIWNTANGSLLQTFTIAVHQFSPLILSRDGTLMISTDDAGALSLWNVKTGKLERTLASTHCHDAGWISLSLDGSTLASMEYGSSRVPVWRLKEPITAPTTDTRLLGRVPDTQAMSLAAGGKAVVAAAPLRERGEDGVLHNNGIEVRRWDLATHEESRTVLPDAHWIERMKFSADGRFLAAALGVPAAENEAYESGGGVAVWDIAARRLLRTVPGKQSIADLPALSPDGRQLAVGTNEGLVTLWDVAGGAKLREWPFDGSGPVVTLTFLPGERLAVVYNQGIVKIYETASGNLSQTINTARGLKELSFSADGALLATASNDWDERGQNVSQVEVWKVATGELLWGAIVPRQVLNGVAFAPDGKTVLAIGFEDYRRRTAGTIQLWDAANGTIIDTVDDACAVEGAVFAADSHSFLTYNARAVKLWSYAG
jgi:WD40 repeat protein